MTQRRSAFTLGELGAVLAATGVALALAYSAYRTYVVRQQVGEGIALANELIPAVTEFFHRRGDVPAKLEKLDHSFQATSPFVESVTIVDGRIDVLFGAGADPAVAGRSISLTPFETADRHVVWTCGNAHAGPGLHPLGFAGGGAQAVPSTTTIEPRYLPVPCR